MRLINLQENIELTISVAGYEFPQIVDKKYDSNWLNICLSIKHPQGNWTATDPALLTWDMERFAHWLEHLPQVDYNPIVFLEPELEFIYESSKLKVTLSENFLPPWLDSTTTNKFVLGFPISLPQLKEAVADIRKAVSLFPPRAIT